MAQNDMNIANQGFPGFRADLNDALGALVSNSSGATEPATTFAHQFWVDTSANPSVLKIRNADNDAFINIGTISQTGDTFKLTAAGGVSTDTISATGDGTFSGTGQVKLPAGTTAERSGSPVEGMLRYNSDLDEFEGYVDGDWGGIGGGAEAGGAIMTNKSAASVSYVIEVGENGLSVGPITVNSSVTVTVSSGQRWLIL